MKRILAGTLCTLVMALVGGRAVAQGGYKKLPSGLRYKIIPTGKGVLPKTGNAIQVHTIQALNDSTLFSTYESSPSVIELSRNSLENDFIKIFMKMRAGDSAVFFQTAAEFKKQMAELPPFMSEEDTLYGYCKTLRIYPTTAVAMAEKKKAQKGMLISQQARIKEYLAQNNIVTKPTPTGCFITIIKPGSGPAVTKGATVSMQYTGSKFDGTVFDSNIDSAFGHPEPYSFEIGTNAVITGFEEAIMQLKKGGECRIYIPAVLGYGERGNGSSIGPNEDLVFLIRLVDMVPAPAAVKKPVAKKPPVKRKG